MKKIIFVLAFFVVLLIPNLASAAPGDCNPACVAPQICLFQGAQWQCVTGASCTTDANCASGFVCRNNHCAYPDGSGGGGDVCNPACTTGFHCNNRVCVADDNGGGACGDILSSRCSTCPASGYEWESASIKTCFVDGYDPNVSGSCLIDSHCGGNTCSLMTQGFCGCPGYNNGSPISACCQSANTTYFVKPATASLLAGCLGGTVESSQLLGPWRFMDPTSRTYYSQYLIKFRNGVSLGAGLLADRYKRYSKTVADQMTYAELTGGGGGGPVCGNRVCETGETPASCFSDCGANGRNNCSPACVSPQVCMFVGAAWQCVTGASCTTDANCASGFVCRNNHCAYPDGSGGGGGGGGTSAYINSVQKIINDIISSYKSILAGIRAGNVAPPPPPDGAFPASIEVVADVLNIRQEPNTLSEILGRFFKGDLFTATASVEGENVEGTTKWWKTSADAYVWAGGTIVR